MSDSTATVSGGVDSTSPSAGTDSSVRKVRAARPDSAITVNKPQPGETVSSPLTVWGEARGSWYFEASFPVKLLDAQGHVLASGPAQAKGDWMTEDFVPYEVTLRFTAPAHGSAGRIVLEKSNASGEPSRDARVVLPVRF
jgi:hypothetical protein